MSQDREQSAIRSSQSQGQQQSQLQAIGGQQQSLDQVLGQKIVVLTIGADQNHPALRQLSTQYGDEVAILTSGSSSQHSMSSMSADRTQPARPGMGTQDRAGSQLGSATQSQAGQQGTLQEQAESQLGQQGTQQQNPLRPGMMNADRTGNQMMSQMGQSGQQDVIYLVIDKDKKIVSHGSYLLRTLRRPSPTAD